MTPDSDCKRLSFFVISVGACRPIGPPPARTYYDEYMAHQPSPGTIVIDRGCISSPIGRKTALEYENAGELFDATSIRAIGRELICCYAHEICDA